MKIIKFVATRCQILRLKFTKFDFGWGSAPDPAGGAYSAPPDRLAGFKGAYFYRRGGEGGKGTRGREKGGEWRGRREERKGRERAGKEREGTSRVGSHPPMFEILKNTLDKTVTSRQAGVMPPGLRTELQLKKREPGRACITRTYSKRPGGGQGASFLGGRCPSTLPP